MCGADIGIVETAKLLRCEQKSKVSVYGDNVVILGLGASGTAAAQLADRLGQTVIGVVNKYLHDIVWRREHQQRVQNVLVQLSTNGKCLLPEMWRFPASGPNLL